MPIGSSGIISSFMATLMQVSLFPYGLANGAHSQYPFRM